MKEVQDGRSNTIVIRTRSKIWNQSMGYVKWAGRPHFIHPRLWWTLYSKTHQLLTCKMPVVTHIHTKVPVQFSYFVFKVLQRDSWCSRSWCVGNQQPRSRKGWDSHIKYGDLYFLSLLVEQHTKYPYFWGFADETSKMIPDDFVINITLNNMIMQLRKCCNHPYLVQYPLIPGTDTLKVKYVCICKFII